MLKRRCLAVFLSLVLIGCSGSEEQQGAREIEPLDIAGVENVYRISPRIITGAEPDGAAGFAELQKLGVKTIVSVTDATPDVEAARKYGIEYVHVPMDYEGVSPGQREKILGAATEASGPVYIHCNSGRNRGATAAAICLIGIEGASHEEAVSWMKTRGVDEEKRELYDSVLGYTPEPATGKQDDR
ncbi:dual specificity protein phosphatase family protein [bacterium]|nr:dual specificity protein phosphatase family protein [bacterium]